MCSCIISNVSYILVYLTRCVNETFKLQVYFVLYVYGNSCSHEKLKCENIFKICKVLFKIRFF